MFLEPAIWQIVLQVLDIFQLVLSTSWVLVSTGKINKFKNVIRRNFSLMTKRHRKASTMVMMKWVAKMMMMQAMWRTGWPQLKTGGLYNTSGPPATTENQLCTYYHRRRQKCGSIQDCAIVLAADAIVACEVSFPCQRNQTPLCSRRKHIPWRSICCKIQFQYWHPFG